MAATSTSVIANVNAAYVYTGAGGWAANPGDGATASSRPNQADQPTSERLIGGARFDNDSLMAALEEAAGVLAPPPPPIVAHANRPDDVDPYGQADYDESGVRRDGDEALDF